MPMNVKAKALGIVSAVILVLSVSALSYGLRLHDRHIEGARRAQETTIAAAVGDFERYFYAPYQFRLGDVLAENEELPAAFAARDRERLLRLALPLYERRKTENPFLHAWHFVLPDGMVFLRVEEPGAHGDDVGKTREMVRAVSHREEPVAGFDVGRHGAMYWVVRPVRHRARFVGITELGLPAEQLMQALARRFGTDVALAVQVAEWQKATMVGSGYHRWGDQVLIAPAASRYRKIPEAVVFGADQEQRVGIDGGHYVLHTCAVLRDYRGRGVGRILMLQDISEEVGRRREFLIGALGASGLLLTLSFAALYASFDTLIGRLERSAAATRAGKEEIERSRNELDERVRERTAELQRVNASLQGEVAERERAQEALRDSQARLVRVLDGLDAAVFVADLETYEVFYANQYARLTFGEMIGKRCWESLHTGQTGPCSFCSNRTLAGADGPPAPGAASPWEFRHPALGRWFAMRERAIPWGGSRLVRLTIASDITARKIAEEKIQSSLREKELLLKEVHHRVKNNMQIISSLLRLQSAGGDDGAKAELVRESQSRIRAMSLIHEKLYRSADISRIDMGDYLASLVDGLTTTYGVAPGRVKTRVEVDQVTLNIDTAVLCGLIVNELVTNSLKHAFPGTRAGEVRVALARLETEAGDGLHEVVVQDDGVGLPANVIPEEARSLGLQLVAMLARHQLQGEIDVSREGGTRFSVRFHELRYPGRT